MPKREEPTLQEKYEGLFDMLDNNVDIKIILMDNWNKLNNDLKELKGLIGGINKAVITDNKGYAYHIIKRMRTILKGIHNEVTDKQ